MMRRVLPFLPVLSPFLLPFRPFLTVLYLPGYLPNPGKSPRVGNIPENKVDKCAESQECAGM